MASTINASTAGVGGVITTADNTGILNIQSGGTTVAAVTSTGVAVTGALSASGLITKTNPAATNTQFFAVSGGTTAYTYGQITNTGANLNWGIDSSTGGGLLTGSSAYSSSIYTGTATSLHFGTNNILRMTLNASGNLILASRTGSATGQLQVGRTANTGATNAYLVVAAAAAEPYPVGVRGESASQGMIAFYDSADTVVGSITKTVSTVAYNTSSDYRLKENIAPMTGSLDTVAKLKPVTYNWKADGSDGRGFIAHELAEVIPDCVTGEKDAVDAEGNPVYQGIDTSFLVATLTSAIQELKAIVDTQADQIKALQGITLCH
jgi:hypothetical protein